MALAERFQLAAQPKIVEREVIRQVVVKMPADAQKPEVAGAQPIPPAAPQVRAPVLEQVAPSVAPPVPLPVPRPLAAPAIGDPRCDRLVREAREARVSGDMGRAIVKLEEALGLTPSEPAVLHELGLVHEQMGVYDRAADYYQKVFELGTAGAGSYYESAATKLRDGFENPADLIGRFSLGRVRIYKHPHSQTGEQVLLTIPVQKAPTFEADANEIEVSVVFFNRTQKGDIIQLEDPTWVREQWVSLPFDWTGDEELLRMTYTIPPQDQQTEHLFGARSYHGQVVTLRYQGEILDVQAWPRELAARLPTPPSLAPPSQLSPDFLDTLPMDFDPDLGVLPPVSE